MNYGTTGSTNQYPYNNNLIMNTPYNNYMGVNVAATQYLKCRPVASKE